MAQDRRRRRWLAGALAALALAAACSGDDGDDGDASGDAAGGEASGGAEGTEATAPEPAALPEGWEGYSSELYADEASWLCRPGEDDVCARDLDATSVAADGSVEVQPHEPDPDAPVDCFYVYPTVSTDATPNSDMEPTEGDEPFVTYNQAARLTASCRVYAPIYRQLTLGMLGGAEPPAGVDPRQVAYDDVLDAFRHYVANDSDGRGVVLVGHSQGAGHLRRLIAEEVDGEPALRDRLVGAYIIGSSVAVPEGEVVGGDFAEVPLCEEAGQVGCVVSYASFRSTAPPPEESRFGRVADREGVAACVNPARPEGGPAELTGYIKVDPTEGSLGPAERITGFAPGADAAEVTTPFITTPGLVTGECVSEGGFSYLRLTVNGDPDDPRMDDIPGDLTPEWGMHLVDVGVAMGDIVTNVGLQADTYTG